MTNKETEARLPSAREILQRVADTWKTDPGKVHWHEGGPEAATAFSWWPGAFRVKVAASQDLASSDPAVRIRIDTDFLREIDWGKVGTEARLASVSHLFTSTYAWVYMPSELQDRLGDEAAESLGSRLWLSATAYIRQDTEGWLPEFLARMAILQPINAGIQAGVMAQDFDAAPDNSSDPLDPQSPPDEILGVLAEVFRPIGERPNRWNGCEEFASFAENWGRSENCFGFGDPSGMTLETPFGEDSALIRFHTDQAHPQLGNGLLATLQLPIFADEQEVARLARDLNYLECIQWTQFPLLGCWHTRPVGERFVAAFSMFVPNALHQPLIATNAAWWMLGRARWVRSSLFPDLVDHSMSEILERRLAGRR